LFKVNADGRIVEYYSPMHSVSQLEIVSHSSEATEALNPSALSSAEGIGIAKPATSGTIQANQS
jgi:hypothetical protein